MYRYVFTAICFVYYISKIQTHSQRHFVTKLGSNFKSKNMQIIVIIEASSSNLSIEIQLQLLVSIVLRSLLFEEVSCA